MEEVPEMVFTSLWYRLAKIPPDASDGLWKGFRYTNCICTSSFLSLLSKVSTHWYRKSDFPLLASGGPRTFAGSRARVQVEALILHVKDLQMIKPTKC